MRRIFGIAACLGLLLAAAGLIQLAQAQTADDHLRADPVGQRIGTADDPTGGTLVFEVDRELLFDGFNLLALKARGVGVEDDRLSLAVSLESNVAVNIQSGDPWYYLVDEAEPPADWNQLGHDHGSWNVGLSAAAGDDGAVEADSTAATGRRLDLLIATPFRIDDPSAVEWAELRIDHDDAFTVYLNGRVVAEADPGAVPDMVADAPGSSLAVPAPEPEGVIAMTVEAPFAEVEPAAALAGPLLEPEMASASPDQGMGGPIEALPVEPEIARVAAAMPVELEIAAVTPAEGPGRDERSSPRARPRLIQTGQSSSRPDTIASGEAASPPVILRGSAIAPKPVAKSVGVGGGVRIAGGRRLWMVDPATQDVRACWVGRTTDVGVRVLRCVSGTTGRYHRGFGRAFQP
jgi:hypothetical protein